MKDLETNIQKYLPYLEDIQQRFYYSTLISVIAFFVGFFSSGKILKTFIKYFDIESVTIATTSPFQFASVAVNIGIFTALLTALLLFMYHFFMFASNALTKRELKKLLFGIPVSLILFITGFTYGFFLLFYSFTLLAKVNQNLGIQNIWDISLFMSQIAITSALLGLIFQLPLILTALIKLKVVTVEFLKSKRRLVILLICIMTSLLPPTDGLSLIAMALPLYVLYEVTIFIN